MSGNAGNRDPGLVSFNKRDGTNVSFKRAAAPSITSNKKPGVSRPAKR